MIKLRGAESGIGGSGRQNRKEGDKSDVNERLEC